MTKAEFTQEKGQLTVHLIGDIDHHGASMIRYNIDTHIMKAMVKVVVIDFTGVTFMDSSGIGLVLARHKTCQDCGASLYVSGVDRQMGKILALAGIRTIQNINV
ncbi:MAG: anti-sigma factor antagonist [Oscillospiraceae bacterium]|nr:anti-sigma factor antagonist [Oscillospiraceae bacterium]